MAVKAVLTLLHARQVSESVRDGDEKMPDPAEQRACAREAAADSDTSASTTQRQATAYY